MPQFLVHTQQGGGCDYTIGCGHRVDLISADTLGAAVEKVRQQWFGLEPGDPSALEDGEKYDGEYAVHPKEGIKKVTIYEIGGVVGMDVASLFREVEGKKAAREKVAKEARDRAQYEALKAQFEPKS